MPNQGDHGPHGDGDQGHNGDGGHGNKIAITVVVNGQPTVVEANIHSPLRTIIPKALEQTGNVGQPPNQWELRDQAGELLELDQKIEDYHFAPNTTLFLNLQAGVGG